MVSLFFLILVWATPIYQSLSSFYLMINCQNFSLSRFPSKEATLDGTLEAPPLKGFCTIDYRMSHTFVLSKYYTSFKQGSLPSAPWVTWFTDPGKECLVERTSGLVNYNRLCHYIFCPNSWNLGLFSSCFHVHMLLSIISSIANNALHVNAMSLLWNEDLILG